MPVLEDSTSSTFANTSDTIGWNSCMSNNTDYPDNNNFSSFETISTGITQIEANSGNQVSSNLNNQTESESKGVPNPPTDGFDETSDLCNINSIVDFFGDALKRLTETIAKQFANIKNEYEAQVDGQHEIHPNTGVDSQEDESFARRLQESGMDLQKKLVSIELRESSSSYENLEVLNKKLSELEETSIRHAILFNDSYKSHWLLTKRVKAIQNDVKNLLPLLLQIKINQERMWATEEDLLNNLNMIKSNQEQIKLSLDLVKQNQNDLKKVQENIKTQIVVAENGRTASNPNNGQSSRPNLSFYNFNCAVPKVVELFEVPSDMISSIMRSNESFKSTIEFSPENLEKLNEKTPSLYGLIGVNNSKAKIERDVETDVEKQGSPPEALSPEVEQLNEVNLEECKNIASSNIEFEEQSEVTKDNDTFSEEK